jgi:predicted aldo/keto reductase-like oxidoreductase
MEHLDGDISIMTHIKPLSCEEMEILEKAREAHLVTNSIPCTSCGYCMDCPNGVDIPMNLAAYNQYIGAANYQPESAPIIFHDTFRTLSQPEKAPSCTNCGKCLTQCPQKINIPTIMRKITAIAETNPKYDYEQFFL